jgi:hypothetical protein
MAAPDDSQSLTIPGVFESLQKVKRSKLTKKEAFNEKY